MKLGFSSLVSLALCAGALAAPKAPRPNFVFILTDDQDAHMGTLQHMPRVTNDLIHQGATFEKHYCTIAICCPSRVNLWTGKMAHNTNVTNVQPPWGGYPKFIANGFNDHHLAVWLQNGGYNTYYAGKLFNGHSIDNYNKPAMKGYTGSDFFLEPYTYQYFNVGVTHNGEPPYYPVGEYSTDIVRKSSVTFLDEALKEPEKPFFLTAAPVAPHGELVEQPNYHYSGPPQVAPRHANLYKDYKVPRTENFNPDEPSGVSWVHDLPKLNETVLEYNDFYQQERMRALAAVDEMVGGIIDKLDEAGVLDNTYIFYTSDNGFHVSQHRLHPGKMCGFETDIQVPMIIRGPGIKAGSKQSAPTAHTNMAPTIVKLAGLDTTNKNFDAAPLTLGVNEAIGSEHIAVEFWGIGLAESKMANFQNYPNNHYKGIRVMNDDYSFYYSVWCNNERELYDMKADPGQVRNLLPTGYSSPKDRKAPIFTNRPFTALVRRLDTLMLLLKACKTSECISPWRTLHPGGGVSSLTDAMDPRYDDFYNSQDHVSYSACRPGYFPESEGSSDYNVFGAQDGKRMVIDPNWHLWT